MRDAFVFKRTSNLPSRAMTLTSTATFDLNQASSVKFVYRTLGVDERREIVAEVTAAHAIKVDFDTLDVETLARYQWHIEATFSGRVMCFPEDGYFTFSVIDMIEA